MKYLRNIFWGFCLESIYPSSRQIEAKLAIGIAVSFFESIFRVLLSEPIVYTKKICHVTTRSGFKKKVLF